MNYRWKRLGSPLALSLAAFLGLSVMADSSLNLSFQDMDAHVGQAFFVRAVDADSGREVFRLSGASLDSGSFPVEIQNVDPAASYVIDFFVDSNGNGVYDGPPADPAWRLDNLRAVSGETVVFHHSEAFTDIGWPPLIDGLILEGEYARSLVDAQTGMTVTWHIHREILYVGLISPGTGWLSIGFEPTRQMQGANIIIAGIARDVLTIEDHYGDSPISHRKDAVDHIIQAAGSEVDGQSVVEFAIPLDSGDDQDKALTAGARITIILAYHRSDDRLTARHSERSTTSIVLENQEVI